MTVWSLADDVAVRFDGAAWVAGEIKARRILVDDIAVVGTQQSAIADPVGGTAPDSEARAAISAVLSALRSHGLIAS